jgi:hypothetical protein
MLFYVLFFTSNTGVSVALVGPGDRMKKRTKKNANEQANTKIAFRMSIENYLM